MKKILSALLCASLILCFASGISMPAKAVGDVPPGLNYSISKQNEVSITSYNGTSSELVIPPIIEGYPVTEIASHAFENSTILQSVTIPEGVTAIQYAAFKGCSNLTYLSVPDSLISVDSRTFDGCNIDFTLYDNATYLPSASNPYHTLLKGSDTSDTIHPDTKIIADYAYSDCTNLTDITFPEGLTHIGYRAFDECSGITSLSFPANLVQIGSMGFNGCSNLTSVTLNGKVMDLGEDTFQNCENLQYNIYDESKYLGTNDNPYFALVVGADKDCTTHPNTVMIANSAFDGCRNMTSITISEGLKYIGIGAFSFCTGLTNITIPNSVTAIDESAFSACTKLTSIVLGDQLNSIGSYAFMTCTKLASITIPASVTYIGWSALSYCYALGIITFQGDAPVITATAFTKVVATAYYPEDNSTWTADVLQQYDGTITWIAMGEYIPGDLDGIPGINNKDVEYLLWFTLFPDDYPVNQNTDYNSDGKVDNKDVEYLLWHTLFPEDYPL